MKLITYYIFSILYRYMCLLTVIIYPFTFVRVNNSFIFDKKSHTISMAVKDRTMYPRHYTKNKAAIAEIFKGQFIDALILNPGPKVIINTHKWVINNVISDERIQSKYSVKISLQTRQRPIPIEIMQLLYFEDLFDSKLSHFIFMNRDKYLIELTRR